MKSFFMKMFLSSFCLALADAILSKINLSEQDEKTQRLVKALEVYFGIENLAAYTNTIFLAEKIKNLLKKK